MPGVVLGYANAKPPHRNKIANAPPLGLTTCENAPAVAQGGGGWALLDLLMQRREIGVESLHVAILGEKPLY